MAYESVPERLLAGEKVPRSEILAYNAFNTNLQTDLFLHYFEATGILVATYEDDTKMYQMTGFGHMVRQDLVKRIEGDCPECPD